MQTTDTTTAAATLTPEEFADLARPPPHAAKLMLQSAARMLGGVATATDRERVEIALADASHPHHSAARVLLESLEAVA